MTSSQAFLRELDKKLWNAAGSASQTGLGGRKIETMLKDPDGDYFIDPKGYGNVSPEYAEAIHQELEERDYYLEKNVFRVPALARWKTLQDSAKLPAGTEIKERGRLAHSYKFTSLGELIDDALEAVETENSKLKNVLNKNYTQLQIDSSNLAGLIDRIATIPFQHADLHAKDILGHECERSGPKDAFPESWCFRRSASLVEIITY